MNPITLFCRTCSEICHVLTEPDDYKILRASALLRQLLIDSNRLVDVANRDTKIKINFEVADKWEIPRTKMILSMEPSFFALLDGLSPETILVEAPTKSLSRDQFLAYRVIFVDGKFITVRDIIDHCSNVIGGVHIGDARSESQKTLSEFQTIEVGGATVSIRQLLPVLRVVYKAMRPLVKALTEKLLPITENEKYASNVPRPYLTIETDTIEYSTWTHQEKIDAPEVAKSTDKIKLYFRILNSSDHPAANVDISAVSEIIDEKKVGKFTLGEFPTFYSHNKHLIAKNNPGRQPFVLALDKKATQYFNDGTIKLKLIIKVKYTDLNNLKTYCFEGAYIYSPVFNNFAEELYSRAVQKI